MTEEHLPGAEPPPGDKPTPSFGDFFWIGTGCAICIVVGGGGGYLLDQATHLQPVLTFVGLAFGVVSAVLLAVANFRKYL
jgi:Putative F0F1-ATPase subunit Ca2+/Mg2+ transporter